MVKRRWFVLTLVALFGEGLSTREPALTVATSAPQWNTPSDWATNNPGEFRVPDGILGEQRRFARDSSASVPPAARQNTVPAGRDVGPCVAFSPYITGYDPNVGLHPPSSVIDSLLGLILNETTARCIMTYGVLNGLDYAFHAAQQRGMTVIAIIWLDTDPSVNDASITLGIQRAKQYPSTIMRVSCGSEVRTRHGVTVAEPVIRNCITRLKAAGVSQPITSNDTWWEWCNESWPCQPWSLANDLDWIGINIFPWWENKYSGLFPCTTASQAADFHVARRQDVAARYPGKLVIVTEFGWPAGPEGYHETNQYTGQQCGTAGMFNQRLVIDDTVAKLAQLGLTGVVFEAFGERWKTASEGPVGPHWGVLVLKPTPGDFDRDRRTDRTVFRPGSGTFYSALSNGGASSTAWGIGTDVDVLGDYDADAKADVAVWRPSNGTWYIVQSSNGAVRAQIWGAAGDIPLVGDFDGDGQDDLTVYRPSTGEWFFNNSGGGAAYLVWGTGSDQPLLADFDGDGKADPAVFRPSNGFWYVSLSAGGSIVIGWGMAGDIPVPGNFDGDGKADIAVFRPSTGQWFVYASSGGSIVATWGMTNDVPVRGDWDGDGKDDFTVWRPSTGSWYTRNSTGGTSFVSWGTNGDRPTGRQPGT